MKTKLKNIFILMLMVVLQLSALALDYSGDFSTRSILMNGFNQSAKISQEQRDLMQKNKLTPTTKCLCEQAKLGNVANIKLLLDIGLNPNNADVTDYPIYIAAKHNHFDALKLLFERGAKLDRGFNSELFIAIKNKNKEMSQFLLDNNARIDYRDAVTNNSILYYALKNNFDDIALYLIQKGAPVDIKCAKLIKKKNLIKM